jgi:hypothetical protein
MTRRIGQRPRDERNYKTPPTLGLPTLSVEVVRVVTDCRELCVNAIVCQVEPASRLFAIHRRLV